jgi:hypothetical protein
MIKEGSTDLVQDYITANQLGSEYITVIVQLRGITWLMITKLALHINKVGELCKAGGLKLAYHNKF